MLVLKIGNHSQSNNIKATGVRRNKLTMGGRTKKLVVTLLFMCENALVAPEIQSCEPAPEFDPCSMLVLGLIALGIELSAANLDARGHRRELHGVLVIEATVRTQLIVALPPLFDLRLGVLQRQEPMLIEALLPQSPVERLNECVISWLTRSTKIQMELHKACPAI